MDILHWYQEEDDDRVVVAPTILRLSRENSDARYYAARAALDVAGVPRGARVLDIGCGISAQAEFFADFRYVGADLNRPRLGRGRRTHPWALYAVQDVTCMGWGDSAFDAILCLEVIEHLTITARPGLMRELFRALRPGGALVLSTPSGRITPWKRVLGRKCERSHEQELTQAEVRALVAQAGGTLRSVESVDNLILPAGRVSAGIMHLVAPSSKWRQRLQTLARAAGYETLLYLITSPVGKPAVSSLAAVR